ncbi:MAG: hypothetical protein ACKVE4_09555 [Dissulfuribacterales bacterium]
MHGKIVGAGPRACPLCCPCACPNIPYPKEKIMTTATTEQAFEEAIEKSLIEKGGYAKGNPSDFSRELAFDSKTIFAFLKDTQPQSWGKAL